MRMRSKLCRAGGGSLIARLRTSRLETGTNYVRSGMIFGIAHDRHPAAVLAHQVALGDTFFGVVRALGLDVGVNFMNEGTHVPLRKDDYSVYIGESGENFCTFFGRHYRAALALKCADGVIGVHGDNQAAAKILGGVQIADVANVQDVEAAIGERDALARRTPLGDTPPQLVSIKNLRVGWFAQWFRTAGGASIMACSSSFRVTVAVPRFITTMPPA